jgi:twitching motility protein PilJ
MTHKASGAKYVPAIACAGLLLLLGALAIVLQVAGLGSDSGRGAGSGKNPAKLQTLLTAQSTILVTRQVLTGDSAEAYGELPAALQRLQSANTTGLSAAQQSALRNLVAGIEAVQINSNAAEIVVNARNALDTLLPELEDASNVLEQTVVVQGTVAVAAQLERLRMLAESLRRDINQLAAGYGDSVQVVQRLLDADMAMAQIVRGFESGDPSLGLRAVFDEVSLVALETLSIVTAEVSGNVKNVLAVADNMATVDRIRRQLDTFATELSPGAGSAVVASSDDGAGTAQAIIVVLIGAAMLTIMFMGWTYYRATDVRKAVEIQAEQTERNQGAIVRLLDELDSLADGDLTVKATVTEDITGAIADSINYAIEALRELVITINDSSIMVDAAARQTDKTAQQLAEASESQSNQIEAASEAIQSMAASIEEISGNAERSSDVARHSVDVAHKGGDAVRRTIEGMNTIRETIQDTSKRIKRLGESSQEIGNIVELINDIADQTNILALNASIQASMAGEAGRGFAVVADEVQRLAERSANATKQIEVLVRTIQSDTNEAVVSMERSTTDVVGGALLAENAGAALEEIEQVSNQIASLVQNISGSARTQSGAAATVTRNMTVLQEINSETEATTSATTESIRKLAELATQLRNSVEGFRIPVAESSHHEEPKDDEFVQQSIGAKDSDVSVFGQKTA